MHPTVYFLTSEAGIAMSRPCGGEYVLRNTSRILSEAGYPSKVVGWRSFGTCKPEDWLVVPEIYGPLINNGPPSYRSLKDLGRYRWIASARNIIIYNQGGFSSLFNYYGKPVSPYWIDRKVKGIFSVSEFVTDLIRKEQDLTCPVFFIPNHVEYSAPFPKESTIAYMPRRLPLHSEWVTRLFRPRLPTGWKFQAIEKLAHPQVLEALAKSRIFMAFSGGEGFGLPPAEAAAAGNLVLGYPAGGGSDFFDLPGFKKIEYGNVPEWLNTLEQTIANYSELEGDIESTKLQIRDMYSERRNREAVLTACEQVIRKGQT